MAEMSVADLWLPILLAGLATHVWSTLAWTVLPHHKPEIKGLGDKEDELLSWVEGADLEPGKYLFPFTADTKEASSEEFKQKQLRCRGHLVLWEKPVSMPVAILKTLCFFLIAAYMIGFVVSLSMHFYTDQMSVFRFVFALGVLTHCFAKFPHLFWFPEKYVMSLLDGIIYALITAAIFALLWPVAAEPEAAPLIYKAFE